MQASHGFSVSGFTLLFSLPEVAGGLKFVPEVALRAVDTMHSLQHERAF